MLKWDSKCLFACEIFFTSCRWICSNRDPSEWYPCSNRCNHSMWTERDKRNAINHNIFINVFRVMFREEVYWFGSISLLSRIACWKKKSQVTSYYQMLFVFDILVHRINVQRWWIFLVIHLEYVPINTMQPNLVLFNAHMLSHDATHPFASD